MPAEVTQLVRLLESILLVAGIGFAGFGVFQLLAKRAHGDRGGLDGTELWTIVLGVALTVLGGSGFISGLLARITLG